MLDDAIFWDRLKGMPHVEAERMLRDRRLWAIQCRHAAQQRGDGDEVQAFDLLTTKLNDELHRVCQLQNVSNIKRAMRAVLTPEQIEAVYTQLAIMDPQATR